MTAFNDTRARDIIRAIRLGDTLQEATKDADELLAVYDWLDDQQVKLDGKPFSAVYAKATQDQQKSWADMSKHIMDNINLAGDRADSQRISQATARSRHYLALSKESRTQVTATIGEAADKEVQITIRKFHDTEKIENVEKEPTPPTTEAPAAP